MGTITVRIYCGSTISSAITRRSARTARVSLGYSGFTSTISPTPQSGLGAVRTLYVRSNLAGIGTTSLAGSSACTREEQDGGCLLQRSAVHETSGIVFALF